MLDYQYYRVVTDSMFPATGLVLLGLTLFLTIWYTHETDPLPFKLVPTQRLRYTLLWLATLLCFVPPIFILWFSGVAPFCAGLSLWFSIDLFGWPTGLSMIFGLLSPILTLLTAIHIYRKPYQMSESITL